MLHWPITFHAPAPWTLISIALDLVDQGTSPITLNATIVGLNFLFDVTLGRPEAMAKMQSVRVPLKLPVVLSKEEVTRLLGCVSHIKHQTALSVAGARQGSCRLIHAANC